MNTIIFSKLPKTFVQDKIVSKLKDYNILVTTITNRSTQIAQLDLDRFDIIVFMNELAAHEEYDHIKTAAKKYNKPVVCLSRKVSAWPEQLKKAGIIRNQEKINRSFKKPEIQTRTSASEEQEYIKLQEEEIDSLRKALDEANKQIQILRKKNIDTFKTNIALIKEGIAAKLFSHEEAINEIFALTDNTEVL